MIFWSIVAAGALLLLLLIFLIVTVRTALSPDHRETLESAADPRKTQQKT
jgi:hypothetical protein